MKIEQKLTTVFFNQMFYANKELIGTKIQIHCLGQTATRDNTVYMWMIV